MRVIAKKRGSGKTCDLIKLASQIDGVIVCVSRIDARLVLHMARCMGVNIRTPIQYSELRGLDRNTKVLFDNAEHTLQALLLECYGVQPSQVAAITVTAEEDEFEKLKRAAQPLVDYIRENHDPHTTVLVENDFVRVQRDGLGVPFPMCQNPSEWLEKSMNMKGRK